MVLSIDQKKRELECWQKEINNQLDQHQSKVEMLQNQIEKAVLRQAVLKDAIDVAGLRNYRTIVEKCNHNLIELALTEERLREEFDQATRDFQNFEFYSEVLVSTINSVIEKQLK